MFKLNDDAKVASTRTPTDAEATAPSAYREPQVFPVGKAVDLLQSYSYGAYEDRYTGYKWNR